MFRLSNDRKRKQTLLDPCCRFLGLLRPGIYGHLARERKAFLLSHKEQDRPPPYNSSGQQASQVNVRLCSSSFSSSHGSENVGDVSRISGKEKKKYRDLFTFFCLMASRWGLFFFFFFLWFQKWILFHLN